MLTKTIPLIIAGVLLTSFGNAKEVCRGIKCVGYETTVPMDKSVPVWRCISIGNAVVCGPELTINHVTEGHVKAQGYYDPN